MTSSNCARARAAQAGSPGHAALSAIVFALTLALACPAAAGRMQGRVKHGVYQSPAMNFTVPVPKGMGTRVSDDFREEGNSRFGAVSFHDDFGNLMAIHYASIPPEAAAKFSDPDGTRSLLDSWLSMFAMPTWFLNASPQSRMLHQSVGSFEGLEVLVAQVEIPGGSPLVVQDSSGTRRMDSVRGLVIFQRGEYIYMLATETRAFGTAFLGSQTETAPISDAEWLRFVDRLKPFYRSIEFAE